MSAPAPGWMSTLVEIWRDGQGHSLVGPGDPTIHLDLARALASALDGPQDALDLGSGAGIPGLALAGLWPESRWTLLDAALRRTRYLHDAVEMLSWGDRVTVVHGRAEDLGHDPELRGTFDLVTSRSFGAPALVAECGAAFLRLGGTLAVTEPPGSRGDRWPAEGLRTVGLVPVPGGEGVQHLIRREPLPDRFPRRPKAQARRPLF